MVDIGCSPHVPAALKHANITPPPTTICTRTLNPYRGQEFITQYMPVRKYKKESTQEFTPSWAKQGVPRTITQETLCSAQQRGIQVNPRYQGEFSEFAYSNAGCRPSENCSVSVAGIDKDATKQEIFAAIVDSKIFHFSRSAPAPARYGTAAADVVFHERAAVDRLLQRASSVDGVIIRGQRVTARENKNMVPPR